MRLPVVGIIGAMLLGGCQPAPASVDGAWIRLSAVQGRPAAAYFTLAPAPEPRTLLSVRTPIAVRSELHETMKTTNGMMSMTPMPQLAVPAGQPLAFAPGGKHVMLFDVAPAVKAGGTAKLTFAFADGKTLEADAKVLAAGDAAPYN